MRLLSDDRPPAWGAGGDVESDLPGLYAYPDATGGGRSWVRGNMVTTVDGAATGADGVSGSINTGADRHVFPLLRALSDAVVVGAGTVRAEGYGPVRTDLRWREVRRGRSAHPSLVVVSGSARLPAGLTDGSIEPDGGPVLVATCAAADPAAVAAARAAVGEDSVLVLPGARVDPAGLVAELARRGLTRLLVEGGPHLMRDVVAAGVLDEWCVTVVPRVVGGAAPRLVVGGPTRADLALRLLVEHEGTLLTRWEVRRA